MELFKATPEQLADFHALEIMKDQKKPKGKGKKKDEHTIDQTALGNSICHFSGAVDVPVDNRGRLFADTLQEHLDTIIHDRKVIIDQVNRVVTYPDNKKEAEAVRFVQVTFNVMLFDQ